MRTQNAPTGLSIGGLAKGASVGVETIRYYQRRALLRQPIKPLGGQRRYSRAEIGRILFIKRAQELGFTLEEVKSLLLLEDGRNCGETRALAEHKLAAIEARVADLDRMRRLLKKLIAECAAGKRTCSCPIIATLSGARTEVTR